VKPIKEVPVGEPQTGGSRKRVLTRHGVHDCDKNFLDGVELSSPDLSGSLVRFTRPLIFDFWSVIVKGKIGALLL